MVSRTNKFRGRSRYHGQERKLAVVQVCVVVVVMQV